MTQKIWDDYAEWDAVARMQDSATLRDTITGYKDHWIPNSVSAYFDAVLRTILANEMQQSGPRQSVIDFGCGLGRNVPLLRRYFDRVIGIDLPEMIVRLQQEPDASALYDALYSDIAALPANEQPQFLYESVVFQHIVDRAYAQQIVQAIMRFGSLRALICLENHDVDAPVLQLLRAQGWQIIFREVDTASFLGNPHVLLILQRPEGITA